MFALNSKKIFTIIAVTLSVIVFGCSDKLELTEPVASNSSEQESDLVWNFPEIDKSLDQTSKTIEELLSVYNIPKAILDTISTKELVKICMVHPHWGLIHVYNDRRTGMSVLVQNFNGFQELFYRNDAAIELLKAYNKLDPLAINPMWTPLEQGIYSAKFEKFEMLLSSRAMIDKLDKEGIQSLQEVIISKYQKKKELPEIYSLWDLSTTVAVCLNILQKENSIILEEYRGQINYFMNTYMSEDLQFLDTIVELLRTTVL